MELRPSCLCNRNFTSWAISPTQGATFLYSTAGFHETQKQQQIIPPSVFQSSHVRSFMLLQKDWLENPEMQSWDPRNKIITEIM